MKSYFLCPLAFGVLFLASVPTQGKNTTAEEKTAEIEALCRQISGKKARPPKMRGLYFARALFGPSDIVFAEVAVDSYSEEPVVMITFSKYAAKRFANLTAMTVGKAMPIFLNGTLLSCPIVNEPIFGGQVQIGGNFSSAEAAQLALRIKSYAR